MTKNLKLSFILYAVFFSIVIAWNTLGGFFTGVGLNFVATIAILSILLLIYLSDKFVASRTKELFIITCVYTVLEFIVYFFLEYRIGNYKTWQVFVTIQNVFAFIAIFVFAYVVFRFMAELKGLKFGIIETILGNKHHTVKVKKVKELSNGSLEDKPNHIEKQQNVEQEENVVIENDESTEE